MAANDMATLPGWAIDLIRDGIRGPEDLTSAEVIRAVRRVMLSAHRHKIGWPDMYAALTDTSRNRLALQIQTGRRGKRMATATVLKMLQKHWEDTAGVAAQRPTWSRDDVLDIIEEVSEALAASVVPDAHRRVVEAALAIARQKGTTRPTLPVRPVAELAKLSKSRAGRVLERLSEDGDWLRRVQRGNYKTRRASLYALAPALTATYAGATPPESHTPPKSHPPKSHLTVVGGNGVELATLTEEELAEVLAKRSSESQARVPGSVGKPGLAQVLPLRPPPLAPELEGHGCLDDYTTIVGERRLRDCCVGGIA